MFSEKSKLVDRRESPFYGSYKEESAAEEIYWKNKRQRQQLAVVSAVVVILVVLCVGITLAITLPPLIDGVGLLEPPDPPSFLPPSPSQLRKFETGAVSSESALCSQLGRDVMEIEGGGVVDAGVLVTLCHGVTNPQSSGIGGGAFIILYQGGKVQTINAREVAPLHAAQSDLYTNNPLNLAQGGLSVGVPGELLGLWEAHAAYGKIEWATLLDRVCQLAENGTEVSAQLAASLKANQHRIKADPALASEFVDASTGEVYLEGAIIARPKLAATLREIQRGGSAVFYNGSVGAALLQEVRGAGGNISAADLEEYKVEWDEGVAFQLTGNLTLHALKFPSSGPVVGLSLGILHGFGRKKERELDWKERGADEHLLAETLKFAMAHRSLVADPKFSDNVTQMMNRMLESSYADELRDSVDPFKTFDDPTHYGAQHPTPNDQGTAHISILGPDGDAFAITTSINLPFGAGFMGEETGILYNSVMADFSVPLNQTSKENQPLPNPNNYIQTGKQPGSSMSPLILINDDGLPVLATGASGGIQILPALIASTWRALYRDMDIKQAIDYARFMPLLSWDAGGSSELLYEYGLPAPVVTELARRGHLLRRTDQPNSLLDRKTASVQVQKAQPTAAKFLGNVNAVCKVKQGGLIVSNADWRKRGDSAGF